MKRVVHAITNSFASFFSSLDDDRKEMLRAQKHMEGRTPLTNTEFGHHYFSPVEADVAAQIRAIFAKHIEVDVSRSLPDDKLVEELRMDALDSMSAIEFVLELEEHFNITIPDSAARQMRTLRDLTRFIACELKSNGCA